MNLKLKIILLLISSFAFIVPAFAGEAKFVGAKKCKVCHKKAVKDGNAYGIWLKSKHAGAYKLLASDLSKSKAVELGIKTNPQETLACLICHTAGAEAPASRFKKTFKKENGVQCENCHGAGSKFRTKKKMKALRAERLAGGSKLAKKYGFTYGDKNTCVKQCHQPKRTVNGVTYINPSYQPFNYKERIKVIAHPMPK